MLGAPSKEYQSLASLFTIKRRVIASSPSHPDRAHELGPVEIDTALHLPISGHKSLAEAVQALIRPIEHRDIIIDPVSGEIGTVTLASKYTILPDMLMITLGRFQHGTKIHDRFEYPKKFDFAPLLMTRADVDRVADIDQFSDLPEAIVKGGSNPYTLRAVICHKGDTPTSGHYYVYINARNVWFKFDDDLVTLVSPDEVFEGHFGGSETPDKSGLSGDGNKEGISKKQGKLRSHSAYMLLYVRDGMAPEPFTLKDIPKAIKASSSPKPLNVKLHCDRRDAITLAAFSDQTVSKLLNDAQSSLGCPTPLSSFCPSRDSFVPAA